MWSRAAYLDWAVNSTSAYLDRAVNSAAAYLDRAVNSTAAYLDRAVNSTDQVIWLSSPTPPWGKYHSLILIWRG